MNREYHRWFNQGLGRDMELLVFGHAGAKVLIFPTRDGRFYEYENMGMVAQLSEKIESGQLQLFCVDSIDKETFYCSWRQPADKIQRHILFERYILNEVIPFMDGRNPHHCRIAHGCSLGAFHATNIALRHPELFKKLCAFSGRYDLTQNVEHFYNLFNGYYDENIYFHSPSHFLPQLYATDKIDALKTMDMIFVIGDEDPFLENNIEFSEHLWQKDIWHALHTWQGRAHRARYWREMVKIYL